MRLFVTHDRQRSSSYPYEYVRLFWCVVHEQEVHDGDGRHGDIGLFGDA